MRLRTLGNFTARVQKEIKYPQQRNEAKNVIDGNIKMYLKMHHIDSFYEVSVACLAKINLLQFATLFFIVVSPRGVESKFRMASAFFSRR